jgi:hypothetical protein
MCGAPLAWLVWPCLDVWLVWITFCPLSARFVTLIGQYVVVSIAGFGECVAMHQRR